MNTFVAAASAISWQHKLHDAPSDEGTRQTSVSYNNFVWCVLFWISICSWLGYGDLRKTLRKIIYYSAKKAWMALLSTQLPSVVEDMDSTPIHASLIDVIVMDICTPIHETPTDVKDMNDTPLYVRGFGFLHIRQTQHRSVLYRTRRWPIRKGTARNANVQWKCNKWMPMPN